MPSKKELNRIDHEDLNLKIHTTESTSRRRNKWQNKAHLDGRIPKRIKSFRDELPPPFNELDDVDPNLAIFVPVEDSGAVAVLRELEGSRALHKLREAIHEAHWWFGEEGTVGWVIALRQLPGGDLEIFADTVQHRNVLQKHSAWETVFLDNLVEESRRYGVSPRGLSVASVPKFPNDDQKTLLIQQLYDWNKSRIDRLGVLEDVLSIEVRETNRGNPMVVVNLAQPEIANEFIAKGIQWGETTYVGHADSVIPSATASVLNWSVSIVEVPIEPQSGFVRKGRTKRDIFETSQMNSKVRSVNPGSRSNDENKITEEENPRNEGMMTTEVINTESPPSDAAKTGKPGVANIEDSDGNPEQELTEASSTAKRSEDAPTSDQSIQNIIKMLHDSSKERELALHQQVESIKPASAKTKRRARCKRQARQKAKATGVADKEEIGTPGGEGNEAELANIVAPATEAKSEEEVKNGKAGHKPSQASGEIDPKVFEPMKPQPMKAPQDREQESIHVPPKSHTEQSAVAQKGILETPLTLPPLIRRFQSRNVVGGN
ncbi:MAG: hypothetical protein LQ339_000708 [Xanthoria mediterranea]|nr:MAG: hypothetical protein LQ339_000708 [Xanthoria mediterranea]